MDFLSYFQLSLVEVYFIIFTVFIASIVRGFNGFGFSATCISGFSFIMPAIEIVPIILILEVMISIFMIPYIRNKIDWNFVIKILIGIIIGSPIGLFLLKYLPSELTHLLICIIIIFFSILLMNGYSNTKINNNYAKISTGFIAGTVNGFSLLGGMPVALFLLVTKIKPVIIRGSLAALFFLTDTYAFVLSFFGDKFFVKSKEETYRKVVFYFLIFISIFGIFRVASNF